jgi:hypothetical protein
MKRVLAGIGATLLLIGVVIAGAATSLGSAGTPAIRSTPPLMTTTVRHEVRAHEQRHHGKIEPQHRERHRRGHDNHHRGRSHGEDD